MSQKTQILDTFVPDLCQKGVMTMPWPFSIYRLIYPEEKYIWTLVWFLREIDKATLVHNGMKIWVPKSRIHRIWLRSNVFEIYVKENVIG